MRRTVGPDNCSAETLHDLGANRFRAAELFGKVLNVASDLRGDHVPDASAFKMLTGDDAISAERKWGHPFQFHFRGLFLWTANTIPTVSDRGGAYVARIRPYLFPHSYLGHEDPSIEAAMMGELPGILVRLAQGHRRLVERGQYLDTAKTSDAWSAFARQTDRVRAFLHARTDQGPDLWQDRRELYLAFEAWCQENKRQSLSAHNFYEELTALGYARTKRSGIRGFRGLRFGGDEEWGTDED